MTIDDVRLAMKLLPRSDRAVLAKELIESLSEKNQDIDSLWIAEIQRRIQDVDEGRVKPIPLHEAFQELRAKYGK